LQIRVPNVRGGAVSCCNSEARALSLLRMKLVSFILPFNPSFCS
jgi:hypothetical protein